MKERRTVRIQTGKPYDVVIGRGLLEESGRYIRALGPVRAAVITDSHVAGLYLQPVQDALRAEGIETESFVFPAGESSKNIGTLSEILEFLAEHRFVRSDVIVALGGGVVGDMAGFAAAVYLRGVRFVQLPTTLLAAVDSSVGGKTAVDLTAGKNLAGAFKQPELVLCDTETLTTLPPAQMENGMAEAIKYGVLFSRRLFDRFAQEADGPFFMDVIEACVTLKGCIVAADEFDNGERRLLNLGHTIGHAIEKCSGYAQEHGRCVAAGMAMIARAGEKRGVTEAGTAAQIEEMLLRYHLPVDTGYSTKALADAALTDKKRLGGEITLVLPRRIGSCILQAEPVERLTEYIEEGRKS